MFNNLLVPIDGSENAREALNLACRLADSDATLHLLYVAEIHSVQEGIDTWADAAVLDQVRRRVEAEGREMLEKARDGLGPVELTVELHLAWGSAARMIVDEADRLGVDAIVMGSRGLSDLAGLVLGSVSHRVLHTAACRVITVH